MNCSLLSLSMVFPSSRNDILLCILLLDSYIRFITLYHSFAHVLQGRSMSISPCNNLDREQLVLFWFLRFRWVFVFLCSQCLTRTFIGAVRSLLSFAGGSPVLEFYVLAVEVTHLGFFISGIVPNCRITFWITSELFRLKKSHCGTCVFTCWHFFRM